MQILKNRKLRVAFILLVFCLPLSLFAYFSHAIPEGHSPAKADVLAKQVMDGLNVEAWRKTNIVRWTFPGGHRYEWFKNQDSVVVRWKKYEAFVRLSSGTGEVFEKGKRVEEKEDELLQNAIRNFNNDSFWLCAPFKMTDAGTSRELVDLEDGKIGLKVFYGSGGSTPGDTYLWIIEGGKPIAWKMWVSIIPIGGLKTKWKDWHTTATGAQIALSHKMLFFNLKIKDLELE